MTILITIVIILILAIVVLVLILKNKNGKIKEIDNELKEINTEKKELAVKIFHTTGRLILIKEKLEKVRDEKLPDDHDSLDSLLDRTLTDQGIK